MYKILVGVVRLSDIAKNSRHSSIPRDICQPCDPARPLDRNPNRGSGSCRPHVGRDRSGTRNGSPQKKERERIERCKASIILQGRSVHRARRVLPIEVRRSTEEVKGHPRLSLSLSLS
ncbi:Uncharacterized protein DBV15_12293, partial [Temnothorax longispinosus]